MTLAHAGDVRHPVLNWAVAASALPGESTSGDRHLVHPFAGGILLAVIDGLGHGREAAEAAIIATRVVARHAGEPLVTIIRRCHEALIGTRGVVATLASFSAADDVMTWLSVGNVGGVLHRCTGADGAAQESILQRGGVVGYDLPTLKTAAVAVAPGDMLVLATDGIRADFSGTLASGVEPQGLADRILEGWRTGVDDALVLVAYYLGRPRP